MRMCFLTKLKSSLLISEPAFSLYEPERRTYGNDSDYHFDSAFDRRAADVASQLRLGLLPERRSGFDSRHFDHITPHGAPLKDQL